jgi:hypothetical protein
MRTAYRALASLIALEIAIQAAAITYYIFGRGKWINDGGVVDKATIESHAGNFAGANGFTVHSFNGEKVIPLLAVLLLLVSFFAQVARGVLWAGLVLVLVAIQVFLGLFGHSIPELGLLHGFNALVLLTVAIIATRLARPAESRAVAPVGGAGVPDLWQSR